MLLLLYGGPLHQDPCLRTFARPTYQLLRDHLLRTSKSKPLFHPGRHTLCMVNSCQHALFAFTNDMLWQPHREQATPFPPPRYKGNTKIFLSYSPTLFLGNPTHFSPPTFSNYQSVCGSLIRKDLLLDPSMVTMWVFENPRKTIWAPVGVLRIMLRTKICLDAL